MSSQERKRERERARAREARVDGSIWEGGLGRCRILVSLSIVVSVLLFGAPGREKVTAARFGWRGCADDSDGEEEGRFLCTSKKWSYPLE